MRLIKDFMVLISFFCASAGVYYGGVKFHVPWYGAGDFEVYYQMAVDPFDNEAKSPYAYRVLTPAVTHYIEKSGLFYDSRKTPYKDHYLLHNGITYKPSILSALIFTNYIFFALAAFFLYKTVTAVLGSEGVKDRIIALGVPILLFLPLSTVVHGYGGYTEGATAFLVSILCYFFCKQQIFLFAVFSFLSIFQRELIPFIILLYVLIDYQLKTKWMFALVSLFAFLGYFVLRVIFDIPGNENQTQVSALTDTLLTFRWDREFLFQALLANNISFFILLAAIAIGFKNAKPFWPFIIIWVILIILGIATGIGNNVGRILNMATPILLVGVAQAIKQMQSEKSA